MSLLFLHRVQEGFLACIEQSVSGCDGSRVTELETLAATLTTETTAVCATPCNPNPCQNDGRCYENEDGTTCCSCPPEYRGVHCEDESKIL